MRYKCDVCDSSNVTVTVEATAGNNVPAEVSYACNTCGESAYWAYGHYEGDVCRFSALIEQPNDQFGLV
jgi:hypothetical protein